jgi:hypothetical protein
MYQVWYLTDEALKIINYSVSGNNMETQQTRFKLAKKIPTVDVDVALLKNIENYILSNIPKMFEVEETEISNKYYTRIKETNGELSLGLIEQYDNTMFPDSTTRITVGVRTNNYKSKFDIDISVTFDKEALFSDIQIDLFDLNPKEKAVGIAGVAAIFHEDITDFAGRKIPSDGYFTGIAHQTSQGWQLQNAHWSIIPTKKE